MFLFNAKKLKKNQFNLFEQIEVHIDQQSKIVMVTDKNLQLQEFPQTKMCRPLKVVSLLYVAIATFRKLFIDILGTNSPTVSIFWETLLSPELYIFRAVMSGGSA